MGARKRLKAEQLKAQKSTIAIAKLNDCPISARKMRLVADIVRGVEFKQLVRHVRLDRRHSRRTQEIEAVIGTICTAEWQGLNDLGCELLPECANTAGDLPFVAYVIGKFTK